MAISYIPTLLPLEEYARIMAVPGWHFNQVEHKCRTPDGACDIPWFQRAYWGGGDKIIGRDELAQAINTAEKRMANACGFFLGPTWVQGEEHVWPLPERGAQTQYPEFKTDWGHLIEFGLEKWDLIGLYESPITYTDTDGDGCMDWATVTITLGSPYYLYYTSPSSCQVCEIAVVPHGKDPRVREWRIRPLQFTHLGAGTYRIEGPRWMFVNPDEWLTNEVIPSDEDAAFLNAVDVYCHYNYPYRQGIYIWRDTNCVPCSEDTQHTCNTIIRSRTGHFYAKPADYSTTLGWQDAEWPSCEVPDLLRVWYLSGYRDHVTGPCDWMGADVKEAIVSLANVYLVDAPCGCEFSVERYAHDREEQEINSIDAAMANTLFGSSARGAIKAYSFIKNLPPLGKGG